MITPKAARDALESLDDVATGNHLQYSSAEYFILKEFILQYQDMLKSRNVQFLTGAVDE
jgi:hypothetical protein